MQCRGSRPRFCTRLAGNPPNPDGLKTDYLWKRILTRAGLTEILESYAQVVATKDERTGRKKRTQIWPRYHQLGVVRRLLADAREHGAGRCYLVQHSAALSIALSVSVAEEEGETTGDTINRLMEAQKLLPNASYFAFTATPKNKTLEIFGEPEPQPDGTVRHRPFHSYTMKQTIQEGFILDVLAHYTPVESYYRLVKKIESDPEFAQIDQLVELYLGGAERDRLDPILDACVAIYRDQLDEDGQVDFKGKAKAFTRTYGFLASILPYTNARWERLSIFLSFLVPKLPAPVEEDLSKGILETIDMDSYRVEKRAAMKLQLPDADATIEPVPTNGGGHRPEPELDRIEHDRALVRVMTGRLKDDTQLFKRFNDDDGFRRWLTDTVFDLTYAP